MMAVNLYKAEESPEKKEDDKIALQEFSNLVGFPSDLVKKELALEKNKDQVSLQELRELVLELLDSTLIKIKR